MFNPEKFRSHFDSHQDFAKASKFEVIIAPPPAAADLQYPDPGDPKRSLGPAKRTG